MSDFRDIIKTNDIKVGSIFKNAYKRVRWTGSGDLDSAPLGYYECVDIKHSNYSPVWADDSNFKLPNYFFKNLDTGEIFSSTHPQLEELSPIEMAQARMKSGK